MLRLERNGPSKRLFAIMALVGVTAGTVAAAEPLKSGVATDALRDADLRLRREMLRSYLSARRAKLDIVATTITDGGQVIDWIPIESQVAGPVATPPPDERESMVEDAGDEPVVFELEVQPHARGPKGTVPILRRDVDSVIDELDPPARLEDFLSKYGKAGDHGDPNGVPNPGSPEHKYASSRQTVDTTGTHGTINVWNPYVEKASEFSLAQTAMINHIGGPGSGLQTVETGWQDIKNLYGDYEPHLFVYYTTNGHTVNGDWIGGYNRDVDGFVQVSPTIFPAAKLPTSTWNGAQYALYFEVRLHEGNWWVKVKDDWIGYYPATLFSTSGLRYGADRVDWYGEIVDDDNGVTTNTNMGSGAFANQGFTKAAYVRNIWVRIGDSSFWSSYAPTGTSDTPGCYTIEGHFDQSTSWYSHFWFGGPGKSASCP